MKKKQKRKKQIERIYKISLSFTKNVDSWSGYEASISYSIDDMMLESILNMEN